jgi:general secretion pathway protein N
MSGRLRILLSGLALYLAALTALAPASLIAPLVKRQFTDRLMLTEAAGTVWRGQASLWAGMGGSPRRLGTLQWRVNPLWLLLGKAHVEVSLTEPDLTLHAIAVAGVGSFRLADVQAAAPATLAATFYVPAELLGLDGQVRLQCESVRMDGEEVSGGLDLWFDRMSSRLSKVSPLGSYRLNASGMGSELRLALTTVSGDLGLAGEGSWRRGNGNLHFEGAARPLARADDLEPLLQVLGTDRGKGQRTLSVNLNLSK